MPRPQRAAGRHVRKLTLVATPQAASLPARALRTAVGLRCGFSFPQEERNCEEGFFPDRPSAVVSRLCGRAGGEGVMKVRQRHKVDRQANHSAAVATREGPTSGRTTQATGPFSPTLLPGHIAPHEGACARSLRPFAPQPVPARPAHRRVTRSNRCARSLGGRGRL